MSIITVQVGQCGNQIGHELFSHLMNDCLTSQSKSSNLKSPKSKLENSEYFSDSVHRWFRLQETGVPVARAVLVDTEQKVINEITKNKHRKHSTWIYDKNHQFIGKSGGSANNWSYGYKRKGPHLTECVLEAVRKEAEESDYISGIFTTLSSSGGTGSGVGSYITEQLRDAYSNKSLVSILVLPYDSGEVVTQNYNTVLTTAKLNDFSDMCVIFRNNHLHSMCSSLLKLNTIEFKNINSLIAVKLASVFQPVSSNFNTLSDTVTHLTPHRGYKFVDIRTAPHMLPDVMKFESRYDWKVLSQHMRKTLCTSLQNNNLSDCELRVPSSFRKTETMMMHYSPSVANLVITRGLASTDLHSVVSEINGCAMYPKWVPEKSRFLHLHQRKCLLGIDRFISLVTNNQAIYHPLNIIVDKAWKMFSYKAYVHQYAKFDVTEEDFLESFTKVEKIIKNYKDLTI